MNQLQPDLVFWMFVVEFRPLHECFRRSVQKYEFSDQVFFKSELFGFSDEINVVAEVDDAVDTGQLFNDSR